MPLKVSLFRCWFCCAIIKYVCFAFSLVITTFLIPFTERNSIYLFSYFINSVLFFQITILMLCGSGTYRSSVWQPSCYKAHPLNVSNSGSPKQNTLFSPHKVYLSCYKTHPSNARNSIMPSINTKQNTFPFIKYSCLLCFKTVT